MADQKEQPMLNSHAQHEGDTWNWWVIVENEYHQKECHGGKELTKDAAELLRAQKSTELMMEYRIISTGIERDISLP